MSYWQAEIETECVHVTKLFKVLSIRCCDTVIVFILYLLSHFLLRPLASSFSFLKNK